MARLAELFDRALAIPPAERAEFVRQVSGDDDDLRQELSSLLEAHDSSTNAFDDLAAIVSPALAALGPHLPEEKSSALTAELEAALAGSYRIERELGGGAMSRVFLAEEIKLGRKVVIKMLPAELAVTMSGERFRREIQLAAQLQHAHIVPLLTSDSAGRLLYYTMPFIAGESLRARLKRERALPLQDAVKIWRDVLDALAHAHARKVVHRDIKPANILLGERNALVTDFGIARAIEAAAGDAEATAPGLAIGTPAYMAPEQATGDRGVDHRVDIYAAALVMYEMLEGRLPFAGSSTHELVSARLADDPLPIGRADCPPALAAIVLRCLSIQPAERPESAEALLTEIEIASGPRASRFAWAAEFSQAVRLAVFPDRVSRRRRWLRAAFALGAAAVGVGWGARLLFAPSERRSTERSRPPTQVTTTGLAEGPVFAPDGKAIAYNELQYPGSALVVRDLNGGEATIFRSGGELVRAPRWSPSGLRILFHSPWSLSVISRLGGERTEFSMDRGVVIRAADFGADDSSFVLALRTRGGGLWLYVGRHPRDVRVVGADSLSGPGLLVHLDGAAESLTHVRNITGLRVSPDRRWAAFVSVPGLDSGTIEVGTLALDDARGHIIAVDTGDLRPYNRGTTQLPSWSPDGDWIYYARHAGSETTVMRVQIGSVSGRRTQGPEVVFDRLPRNLNFDVAPDGRRLAYSAGAVRASLYLWSWDIGEGRITTTEKLVRGTSSYHAGRIAPDGKTVAYVKADDFQDAGDLYIRSLPDGPERLVARAVRPPMAWSMDGKRLGYFAGMGTPGLGLRLIDIASGRIRQIGTRYGSPEAGLAWSPDGRTLAYTSSAGMVVLNDTMGNDVAVPFFRAAPRLAHYGHPVFSPDGRRVAMFRPNGLWVYEIESGRASLVSSGWLFPRRWTADGWIYATRTSSTDAGRPLRLERVLATGGTSHIVAESSDLENCVDLTLTPQGNSAVCTVVEPSTDIWLMELVP